MKEEREFDVIVYGIGLSGELVSHTFPHNKNKKQKQKKDS